MNSSEPLQPLTVHEEKLTAYLDGSLPPEDAAAFEQANPEAIALRQQHDLLTKALRAHSPAPKMRNGDFFNHQIVRQIQPAPEAAPQVAFPWWRLILAGAFGVLAVLGVMQMVPWDKPSQGAPQIARSDAPGTSAVPKYVAKVTGVTAGDYLLTAKVVEADGLAVVWVDGMEKLSKDYVLQ